MIPPLADRIYERIGVRSVKVKIRTEQCERDPIVERVRDLVADPSRERGARISARSETEPLR